MPQEIRIGFVQTDPVFGEKEQNVEHALSLAKRERSDLLVFPELFNTGYAFLNREEAMGLAEDIPSGYTCSILTDESRRLKATFVAGLAEKQGDKVFNSAVVASNGEFVGVYRKAHLFYKEKIWFSPGDTKFQVFDVGAYRLGAMICFDWAFPETARILSLMGADVIAHPSNLVLPGYAQKGMLIRSFENRVFSVTANRIGVEERGEDRFRYTGMSQIVGPSMDVLASASESEVATRVVVVDVSKARDKSLWNLNDIFRDRRVELYGRLLETRVTGC